jgi:hypothetical protein
MQPVINVGGLTALAGTKGGGRRAFSIRTDWVRPSRQTKERGS